MYIYAYWYHGDINNYAINPNCALGDHFHDLAIFNDSVCDAISDLTSQTSLI